MRQTIAFNFVLQIYSLLHHRATRLVGTTGQRTTYACLDCQSSALRSQKIALYLSVKVFSTKVLIKDTTFTSRNGDGTAILRGHPSRAKVQPLAVQREYLHFSVILRPWVLVRPRESNPPPPALQSSALPTELIPPLILNCVSCFGFTLLPGSHTITYHCWQKRNSFRIPSFEKL